ncbi:MAG: uroporphyrinogen decarboxylase family protein [Bacillota bacterium]
MMITSRERVSRTLEGKSTDQVPVNFSGIVVGPPERKSEGAPYGVLALYEYLGIDDYDQPVPDPDSGIVINIDKRVLARLGSDIRYVYTSMRLPEVLPDGSTRDMYGIVTPPDGNKIVSPDSRAPLRAATTVDDIKNYPYWPDPADPNFSIGIPEYIRTVRETTDCALLLNAPVVSTIFHKYAALRGFNNWLLDMRKNEKLYFALTETITETAIETLRNVLPSIGTNVDIIYYGDDMGMQSQPFMSPEMYRKYVKPYTKRWVHEVKKLLPHVKVFYHTCGSVYDLIPDFIECGIDILDPLQPLAYKMEPWRLRKEFGGRICFHGGIDIQRLINFGTPPEIKNRVKEILAIFEGCPYILSTAHVVETDAPPENLVAVYDAAAEYARNE